MIARIKVCSNVNLDQLSHFGAHAMQCMCSSQHEEEVSFHILLTSATSHVITENSQLYVLLMVLPHFLSACISCSPFCFSSFGVSWTCFTSFFLCWHLSVTSIFVPGLSFIFVSNQIWQLSRSQKLALIVKRTSDCRQNVQKKLSHSGCILLCH